MRLWLGLILLVFTLPASAVVPPDQWTSLPKDFPQKVRAFMERRAACIYWGREYPRIAPNQVADAEAKLRCRAVDADEVALKKAYVDNPSVLRFLKISRDWDLRYAPPPRP